MPQVSRSFECLALALTKNDFPYIAVIPRITSNLDLQVVLRNLASFSPSRSSRVHIPLIPLPPKEQFRHVLNRLIVAAMSTNASQCDISGAASTAHVEPSGLKKIPPYWYPYTTMAKGRWLGRELLEVVSTEFRDRSMEYYRYALESGVTTVNGQVAKPETIIRDGDRIENVVHRHEPPVTSTPVKILHHDVEREFIVVDKPGSIPVHASGRFYRNTLIEILENEFKFKKAYPVNRLDRLTSGLMILPLSVERARSVSSEFMAGTVKKEYVARCKGEFPDEEIVCEQPLLTVDRQMGLNIVHPEGKPAKTIFNRIRYDVNTDSSVVRCRPLTGRSHQIRVHLQYLGFPIANDPVYSETKIWGPKLGKGGIDIVPSEERAAPAPPAHLQAKLEMEDNPEIISTKEQDNEDTKGPAPKLLPRETGHDIGMGSPVPLSSEAVQVITNLRNMKDEDEDWSRWRDVVFRAKGALSPKGLIIKPPPPQNRRRRGGAELTRNRGDIMISQPDSEAAPVLTPPAVATDNSFQTITPDTASTPPPPPSSAQLTDDEALAIASMEPLTDPSELVKSNNLYCPECYLPLHPDPKPEKLYIFLHARKYTTSLGSFETEMPDWASEGWTWDQS